MIYEHSYGAVVFCQENKKILYLLIQHSSNFHWGFSRGLKEKGEKGTETAIREIKEETGLDVEIIEGFKHTYAFFYKFKGETHKKTVTYFLAKSKQKQVRLSWEHKAFVWLEFEKALNKLDFDNDKETLRKAHSFLTKKTLKDFNKK